MSAPTPPRPANWSRPQSGIDSNLNGDSAGDRTIVNPAGDPNVGSDVDRAEEHRGRDRRLPRHQSERALHPGAGRRASPTAAATPCRCRASTTSTCLVAKRFNFTEKKALEFRADASNAFNHPQYTAGYVSSVRATSQTNSRVFLIPGNTQFLQWDQNLPSNARSMQFSAKFIF